MDDIALIAGLSAMAVAIARAAFSVLKAHQAAKSSYVLEVRAGDKRFEIDLKNIDQVRPETIKKASEAVKAEKAKAAA